MEFPHYRALLDEKSLLNRKEGKKWREEGDSNPRVLANNGLAVHRLTGLGYLRNNFEQVNYVLITLDGRFIDIR